MPHVSLVFEGGDTKTLTYTATMMRESEETRPAGMNFPEFTARTPIPTASNAHNTANHTIRKHDTLLQPCYIDERAGWNTPRLNSTGCTNDFEDRNMPLTPIMTPNEPPATNEIREPFWEDNAAHKHVDNITCHFPQNTRTLMYAVTPPISNRVPNASVEYTTA